MTLFFTAKLALKKRGVDFLAKKTLTLMTLFFTAKLASRDATLMTLFFTAKLAWRKRRAAG